MSKAIELARKCGFGIEPGDDKTTIYFQGPAPLEAFYDAAFEAGRQAAIAEFAQAIDGIEVKHD